MESVSAPDVDLGSLDFWGQPAERRDEYFARLRDEAPISRHQPPENIFGERVGENYWAVVRYEDVRRVSRDPVTFCSGQGISFGNRPKEFVERVQSFLAMDAPRHGKLRGLVSAAFTPRQVARIEGQIRVNARRIIEDAAATGGGDFVELIAKRLPLQTICDMLGVGAADRERVMGAADTMVSLADPETLAGGDPMALLRDALDTVTGFAIELAAYRERHPGEDLMTGLVQAEIDGERLTHQEIGAFMMLLSIAGNDTTRHSTSHAARALTVHRDQRARLLEDPNRLLPDAVEEFLRWGTPVNSFRRTTTREVELHGQRIAAGEQVVMFYLSANRDERAFPDPWRFDIGRTPNHHLGFGGGGPHYCMGAALARLQLRAIFSEMLRVIPDIETGEPELLRSVLIHGIKRMPCTFTARA